MRAASDKAIELATMATGAASDDGSCLRCNGPMVCDEGCEPTPMCHHCAQDACAEMGRYLLRLRAAIAPTEENIIAYLNETEDLASKGDVRAVLVAIARRVEGK